MRAPSRTDVAALWDDVAAARGTAPALRWASGAVTSFAELDGLAARIAARLAACGVRHRDTVCLALEKSVTAYAAMLACLRLGAPYFAVDPSSPVARTAQMVARCRPAAALVGTGVSREPFGCAVLDVGDGSAAWLDGDGAPAAPRVALGGSDPAYVMFTSGSTGAPKGVTISHANLLGLVGWAAAAYDIGPRDVLTGLNPLFFDNSVFDFAASVLSGASLAPFTASDLREPAALLRDVATRGCSLWFSVPSLLVYLQRLKLVDRAAFPTLRAVVFGGEGYPKPMLARLHADVGDRIALHNVYGPTECTCICSTHRVVPADLADPAGYAPLGRLNAGTSSVVVDEAGREVAAGEVGELLLGGPAVGLGYYADPALSAAAFVQNPTHDRFFDRMYRTGDLVRRDADGSLHFVGRADTQIKHQGYRIELGEIEHALARLGGVAEAAAVHVRTEAGGRILAAVAGDAALDGAALRRALGAALPAYMVPARIAVLASLPKNANGKVDRLALAAALASATD